MGYQKNKCELCVVRSVPIHKWDELPPDLMPLLDTRELKQRCHRKRMERKISYLTRVKRGLYVLPGTNWCGSGNNGRDYRQLGAHAAADQCCRDHDHCPYMIEGLSTKFGLFNFRFYTISYCKCDERFRSCLKLVGTTAANFVGRLFFNIIQTKCFLFRIERVCVTRSWWGGCLKYEEQRRGYIREGLRY
ncbi:acidic phospholipase A2 PA4-like [Limulus polyphemus]|uniref:Acidic phospholipase A2 PA4-like n=1 Tax=Limulus polyphemus TaxID=6850 RepID=A0ABM1BVP3_LIMPO|nr:acidic phospholipase A2 PA4-like [Limulus polyphemus]